MGLDNGIYVRSTHRAITRVMLPEEITYPFERDYDNGVEILYWRKNWGLRNKVVDLLAPINENKKYDYIIDTPNQVFDLIRIIVSFMDKDKWEEDGDSIWEYDEILPILQRDVINLSIIAAFMKNNSDVYLEFYDSY